MEEINNKLSNLIKRERKLATGNYIAGYSFYLVSIVASFLASILIINMKSDSSTLPTIIAGLPGVSILLNRTLKFEERAEWHYLKCFKYEKLLGELEFDNKSSNLVNKEILNINLEMEEKWPRFGSRIN